MSGKFKGGLYKGCPTRESGRIGVAPCAACGGRVYVKMNKSGWPYYHCRDRSCGHDPVVRGKGAAVKMLQSITHWHDKARAFINNIHVDIDGQKLIKRRETSPEPVAVPEPEPVAHRQKINELAELAKKIQPDPNVIPEPVAMPEPEPVATPEPEHVKPKAKSRKIKKIGMFSVK